MEFLEFDVRLRMNSASIKFLLDYIDITDITVLQSLDMRQKERLQHHRRLLHFLGLSNIWSPAWTEENHVSIAGIPKNTNQYLSRTHVTSTNWFGSYNITSISWNILCGTTLPRLCLVSVWSRHVNVRVCLSLPQPASERFAGQNVVDPIGEITGESQKDQDNQDLQEHWQLGHCEITSTCHPTLPKRIHSKAYSIAGALFATVYQEFTQVAYSAVVGIPQDLNIVEIWYTTPCKCHIRFLLTMHVQTYE